MKSQEVQDALKCYFARSENSLTFNQDTMIKISPFGRIDIIPEFLPDSLYTTLAFSF